MKLNIARVLAATAVVAAAALAGTAHARDVHWSVGVEALPGVTLGVSNTRPVVVAPAPVYVQPAPVYVQPAPVYVAPRPVVLAPAPVYYARPAPVVVHGYHGHRGKHRGHGKHRHHRHWD